MSLLGGKNNPLGDSGKSSIPDSQRSNKAQKKKKTTYSLSPATMDDIDMMQLKLKRLLGVHVEKSELIEAAFLAAQKDFERNQDKADFMHELAKLLRD